MLNSEFIKSLEPGTEFRFKGETGTMTRTEDGYKVFDDEFPLHYTEAVFDQSAFWPAEDQLEVAA